MQDRFRIDGADLGVDRVRSVATLGPQGHLNLRIRASGIPAAVDSWATAAPLIVVSGVRVRFDGDGLGATLDQAAHDDLALDDGEAVLAVSSRFDLVGRISVHANDRVRILATVTTPWAAEPWRIDVSLGFGGRRAASI